MSDFLFYLLLALLLPILLTHFAFGVPRNRYSRRVLAVAMFCWLIYCLNLAFKTGVQLREVMLTLAWYGVALYIFLTEALVSGFAARLTRWRGENWTKELDYFYLGLGFVGLIASLGTIENVSDKFTPPGMLAPLLVTTAIVLRALKTRAEIAGWNRL